MEIGGGPVVNTLLQESISTQYPSLISTRKNKNDKNWTDHQPVQLGT